jgi:cysteine desulfurase
MNQNDIEHYFDWAATSPADEDILRSSLEETLAVWGNPSSVHSTGKKARTLLEDARTACADVLGVKKQFSLFYLGRNGKRPHSPAFGAEPSAERDRAVQFARASCSAQPGCRA